VFNFSAFYNNTDITHDPGTVGYGSPLHKNYYLHGLNHNVPLVNGEGQEQPPKGRKPDPFTKTRAGELLEFSVDPPRVAAVHPVYRRDAKARRTLSIAGDKLIDVAEIESAKNEPQKLGLALHLQGRVQLPGKFTTDEAFDTHRPKPFSYWTDVRTATYRDQASFDADYGDFAMKVSIATPGEFRIWHGSTPDSPPNRREGFYVETEGDSARFTTILEPVATEANSE
jgi:oligo-alginate lyase